MEVAPGQLPPMDPQSPLGQAHVMTFVDGERVQAQRRRVGEQRINPRPRVVHVCGRVVRQGAIPPVLADERGVHRLGPIIVIEEAVQPSPRFPRRHLYFSASLPALPLPTRGPLLSRTGA